MATKTRTTRAKRIYMAGPLFTLAERESNLRLAIALRQRLPRFVFVLPQERARAFLPNVSAIVADCFVQVRQADLILACLDGPDADSGTCVEIGYARALQKRVIGYRTDFRSSEADGVNAMLRYGCTDYIKLSSLEFSASRVVADLARRLLNSG
jgi:nucleoside 2-deoxyribosyltransferase